VEGRTKGVAALWLAGALAAALLAAAPGARADGADLGSAVRAAGDEAPDAGAEDPADEKPAEAEPAPAPRPAYRSLDPAERQGRTFDPGERKGETSEPVYQDRTSTPGEHVGETRPLDDLARSPGPQPPPADAPPRIPAPLRLRREPGQELPAGASLEDQLCEAEREFDFDKREAERAVRAYKRARREEYPRGNAKYLVVQRRDITLRRLERSRVALEATRAEADDQGVELDPEACPRGPVEEAPRPARQDPANGP
jgi:hypothetical protein